jgi:hypothetical protein
MSKKDTITVVLNGRYKGHYPGDELELEPREANAVIRDKVGKAKAKAKPEAAEEEPDA